MSVKVQVLDEKGLPVRCTVAAVRTSDQTILNLYTTDPTTGVTTISEAGTWYPRPMVDPVYKQRLRMVILNAQDSMNADYVVDSSGGGTHLTLLGASGALQTAIATGLSKSIWVCSSHSETAAGQESIGALAANQNITIASLGRAGATINWNSLAGAAAFKFTETSPSTSSIHLDGINLSKAGNADPVFEAASAKTMPNITLTNVGFVGTVKWSFVVDLANSNTAVPRQLTMDGCWGVWLSSIVRTTFNTPSANDAFIMVNCDLPGLATISQRDTESAVEWGGANAADAGVTIKANKLGLSNYAWRKTYIAPFNFVGNLISHSGTTQLLRLGSSSATVAMKNASIVANTYYGSQVGCSFALVQNTTGPCADLVIVSNNLNGPGSGTAITTVASTGCAFEPNGFTGWTTNVSGAGTTDFFGGVNIGGAFTASIAHSSLAGLISPADDHTQYAKLIGRGTPLGNIFSGYASWGTGTAGYSSTILGFTPGGYWRMGEASGNLADSSGNGNTATQVGAGQTYGVAGAIVGDANTAITFPGVNTSYYTIANTASIDVADTFTVIWWIKKAANGTNMTIAGRGTNGWEIRMNTANQLQVLKCFVAAIVSSTTTITDTSWHMVAWTKSGATNKLYIDGADVTGAVSNQTISATGGTTTIGRNGQDGTLPWNGSLDEGTIIKGTALTAANISAIYNAGLGAPPPNNTTDGDVTGTRFFVNNDSNFKLSVEGTYPTITWDANDYMRYDRVTNVYYWYAGSSSIVEAAAAALRVRNNGANPGTMYLTGGSSGGEGGQVEMEGAAGFTNWSFDNSSGHLRMFYGGHVYNQFYGPQNGGVAGGTGIDGSTYFESRYAQQASGALGAVVVNLYSDIPANSTAEPRSLWFEYRPTTSFNNTQADGIKGVWSFYRRTAGTGTDTRFDAFRAAGAVLGSGVLTEYNGFAMNNSAKPANVTTYRAYYSPHADPAFFHNGKFEIGSGASVGFYGTAAVAKQTSGANLTNNVTSGGTDDTIADFTDLTTYANDAATIRNDMYQLSRKMKQVNDALRAYGLLT